MEEDQQSTETTPQNYKQEGRDICAILTFSSQCLNVIYRKNKIAGTLSVTDWKCLYFIKKPLGL